MSSPLEITKKLYATINAGLQQENSDVYIFKPEGDGDYIDLEIDNEYWRITPKRVI